MIELTRFSHTPITVNCAHITCVEATPDTVVTLTTGEKLLVRNSVSEVVERTVRYLRQVTAGPFATPGAPPPAHRDGRAQEP